MPYDLLYRTYIFKFSTFDDINLSLGLINLIVSYMSTCPMILIVDFGRGEPSRNLDL